MKKIIKKMLPTWLLILYRNTLNIQKYKSFDTKDVFTKIYEKNFWESSESVSGKGSEVTQTKSLIKDLDIMLKDMNITSVLDIPCGDFNWMRKVNLTNVEYIGADIVENLVKSNIEQYKGKPNLKFEILNLIDDNLPQMDIIIVRDCLVHLSYEDVFKAIKNIKLSGCKYLLTTTFTNNHLNHDIITGKWRKLNLQNKPFNFPEPIFVINENCSEDNGEYKDKSMALWEISQI